MVWFTSTSLSIPIWHLSLSAIIWQYFLQLILQWSWNVIIFHLLVLLVKQSRLVRDHLGLHFQPKQREKGQKIGPCRGASFGIGNARLESLISSKTCMFCQQKIKVCVYKKYQILSAILSE